MRDPIINPSPYTVGFGIAVAEIAHGQPRPDAHETAARWYSVDDYKEYVYGYMAAVALNRDLNEMVAG